MLSLPAVTLHALHSSSHRVRDHTEGVLQAGCIKGMDLSIQSYHYKAWAALETQHSAVEAQSVHIGVTVQGVQLHTMGCGWCVV